MYIRELTESHSREILVIYPGRFQLFHRGHAHVFETAQAKYGQNNCFIATSNKQEQPKSPFTFDEKKLMITATGISPDRVQQVVNPYRAKEIYSHYDPENTIMIYVLGKDIDRFDLSKGSFREVPEDLNDALPMSEQKYVFIVPQYEFEVMGEKVTGATELRAMYKGLDNNQADRFVSDLYGDINHEVKLILDKKIGRTLKESIIVEARSIISELGPGPSTAKPKSRSHLPGGRFSKRWGNQMFRDNKAVFVKTFYKLNDIIKTLNELDPSAEHDQESMQEVLKQLQTIRRSIQDYKGSVSEI